MPILPRKQIIGPIPITDPIIGASLAKTQQVTLCNVLDLPFSAALKSKRAKLWQHLAAELDIHIVYKVHKKNGSTIVNMLPLN